MFHVRDQDAAIAVILWETKSGKFCEIGAVLKAMDRKAVMECTTAKLPPYVPVSHKEA